MPNETKTEPRGNLFVAIGLGAMIGVVVGFMNRPAPMSFQTWLNHFQNDAVLWAVIGAFIGAGLIYLRGRRSN